MKDQKGEPVFPENIDELLAGKIVDHSRKASDAHGDEINTPPIEKWPFPFSFLHNTRISIIDVIPIVLTLYLFTLIGQLMSRRRCWRFFS
ncbi:MAG: hypothetical protein ACOC41_00795 [Chitinivibrionales bacterium]